ncbi:type IV secretion system DNA-binding domain-containing protein [bacterium]|nr:type IV secretion system DNA-binding domain-containing protein [bacterium]NCQ55221.1 type IV secretion system DNA-binding domain-containing protein [Candidatus Parcubacteria bacterium]NCS67266.1 type IV secretion system DNA-binding domain-containing protein [Candidatus Peregrinibacteria bacterium]NCS96521.1 type IV secretion system DNA-binding domain-containing protein [bacterium]
MGTLIRLVLGHLSWLRWLGFGAYRLRSAFVLYRAFFLMFAALFTEAEVGQIWNSEIATRSLSFGEWWIVLVNLVFFALDVYTVFVLARFTIRYLHRRKQAKNLVHLRVLLPRNDSKLDNEKRNEKDFHEAIGRGEQLYRALHETRDLNLYNVWVNRIFWGQPHISFELQYDKQEMSFVIVVDKYYQAIVEKQITSFYESAEIEPIKEEKRFKIKEPGYFANGYYMHTGEDFWYPIETYKQIEEDPLNNMANSFAKLDKEDKGVIQLVIKPISNSWRKEAAEAGTALFKGKKKGKGRIPIIGPILGAIWWPFKVMLTGYDPETDGLGSNAPGASGGDSYVRMLASEEEIAKAIGEKAIQSGFDCSIRVLAASKNEVRVQEILNGMFTSFNVFKGDGKNYFENRRIVPFNRINIPILIHNFHYRLWNVLEHKSLLSCDELATIFHFPDAKYNKIPTIKWLDYKVLPPPIDLPKEGIILGNSVYRGETKPVHMLDNDRTRHTYIVGKSGSGKSVLLEYMAGQDVVRGAGVCVIDPHGDLVEDVLSRTPKERAKDVMVFDPGDRERPMGLNILECKTEEEQDRASLDAMEIFIKLFGNEIFGPRIQHYFRNGCLTLMADEEEGATLLDVPRLFIDDDFQRYKVSKLKNPMVRAFWENEMANTGDREKQEMIPYFTSKFGPFVTNTTMRNIIGQTKSAFNVRQCMDTEKVLLINLSKGKIGDINAQLLGLIMVSKINQAAMARADMPKEDRKDFYLYVDEFQNFATDTFASILSEARKYRLNLIMAHQYIAQLSESAGGVAVGQKDSKIRDAVFGNVGTMMNFKVGAEDAEYFEKEYAPILSAQDILSIANYKAYIKLNINNSTSRPFSMESIWDPDGRNYKIAEIIKKYSRMKYGRKKEFVDAEIEARMGINNINAITATAKADPTVSDSLLGDNPIGTTPSPTSAAAIPASARMAPPVDPTKPLTAKVAEEKAAIAALPKMPVPAEMAEPTISVSVKPEVTTAAAVEPKPEAKV